MENGTNHRPVSGREKILVIDDSPVIREMLVEILTDDGYTVDVAVDGEIGVDMALTADYLMILCDVHMPRKNGLEAVQEIIAAKPVAQIVMTDSLPDKLAQSARDAGALCCLQKPFDVGELRDMIDNIKSRKAHPLGR
jgi:DNA-binding response OmpR family regulator